MFKLQFATGNSAFDEYPATEIARILREVARQIEADDRPGGVIYRDTAGNCSSGHVIRDSNGNRIGAWSLIPREV